MQVKMMKPLCTGGGMDYDLFLLSNNTVLAVANSEFVLYPSVEAVNQAFGHSELGLYDPHPRKQSLPVMANALRTHFYFTGRDGEVTIMLCDGAVVKADNEKVTLVKNNNEEAGSIYYDAKNPMLEQYMNSDDYQNNIRDDLDERLSNVRVALEELFNPEALPYDSDESDAIIDTLMLNVKSSVEQYYQDVASQKKSQRFDYTELDNEILRLIKDGVNVLFRITNLSKAPIPSNTKGGRERAIDRRLQVLRKQGLIAFVRNKGWHLTQERL